MRGPRGVIILLPVHREHPESERFRRFIVDLMDDGIGTLLWLPHKRKRYRLFRYLNESDLIELKNLLDFWENDLYWLDPEWRELSLLLPDIREREFRTTVVVVPFSYHSFHEREVFNVFRHINICVVNLEGHNVRIPELGIDWLRSFDYPIDRDRLFRFLTEPSGEIVLGGRGLSVARDLETTSRMREETRPSPIFPKNRAPRTTAHFDEVNLGASAPRMVPPSQSFVARFAAYTETNRDEVSRILQTEAPSAELRLDLEKCRWRRGARVAVYLEATEAKVMNSVQRFTWDGNSNILRFDVQVNDEVTADYIILRFDVAVEGLSITSLRPEIPVRGKCDEDGIEHPIFIEKRAPRSAFASYARKDRREVLGRVRSLQIFTGIDVFLDCLSLRPGDQWKRRLRTEINQRDVFWLFWSRHAMNSEWVDWEWRTALASKALIGIQPHPLEPSDLAPPPEELSSLQFGALYELYITQLRQPWLSSQSRIVWGRITGLVRKLFYLLGPESRPVTRLFTLALIVILLAAISTAVVWLSK